MKLIEQSIKKSFFFLALLLGANTMAHAYNYAYEPLSHAFGFESFYYDYTEKTSRTNDRYLMSIRGPMIGLVGNVQYKPENFFAAFRLEGRIATSLGDSLQYKSVSTGSAWEPSYYFEARPMGVFDITKEWRVYVGPAVRYLVADSGAIETTTGHWGYMRRNLLLYTATGLEHEARLAHGWRMVSHIEYDHVIQGWQYSGVSTGLLHKQDQGRGFRLGTRFIFPCQGYDLSIGPFFRYWKIEDSDYVRAFDFYDMRMKTWVEPQNTTKEVGLQVTFSLR